MKTETTARKDDRPLRLELAAGYQVWHQRPFGNWKLAGDVC